MNTTTANSTPTGLPAFQQPSFTNNNLNAQTMPLMTPNVSIASQSSSGYTAPTTPTPVAPTVIQQYSAQTGPSTQNYADATYTDKITNAAATPGPVPSTAITSGSNLSTAGAKRSTYETLLQSYLDQQKQFQNQYISSMQQSPEELALSKQLAAQKTQGALNQEQALNSGETSSFAGGEAQRVARTDAIKQAGIAAQLDVMQNARENKVKQLEFLINSGDKSFKTQLEMQKLQTEVSGIDKQAQDTFFNLAQSNPTVDVTYDPTKTALENLTAIRSKIGTTQAAAKSYQSDPEVSSLYNRGLITGGTEGERIARANQIASLPEDQKKQAVQMLARGALNTTQQASYQSNQLASSIINTTLSNIDSDMVNNPYKYMENQYATYFGGKKDPRYTQFIQLAETANAPIRQGYFGASLTTGEADKANSFLVDAKKDDIKTAVIKLNNMKSIADFTNDLMIYDQVGGVRPNLDDYLKLDKNGNPKQKSQDYSSQDKAALDAGYTQAEIDAYKKQKGFSSVGSDTNQATSQNLMGDLGNMQGLMGQISPADYSSTDFGNMNGLMKPTPQLQLKIEIPKTSKLSFINNNPANLRFAGQIGASKGEGGFAKFNSPQEGLNALVDQIKLDAGRGHTLSTFINKFAPPTENDTKLYIQQAMEALGVSKDTPISQIPVNKLAKFMAMKESSTKVN